MKVKYSREIKIKYGRDYHIETALIEVYIHFHLLSYLKIRGDLNQRMRF